ncbi:predicted protein [Chaetoceros tenuissimus]|uniref:Uncharacterized protein n=1 Tax=Chaetoceros tenuissimus TaxID=426638 RepID=A0AAD3HBD6_9STRA|nr:predicted protein [Chaetoceros tenuissimus]
MEDASLDSTKSGSSAAEWITKGINDGEFIVITDEVFGVVGVLELGGNGNDRIINDDETNSSSASHMQRMWLCNLFTGLAIVKAIFL